MVLPMNLASNQQRAARSCDRWTLTRGTWDFSPRLLGHVLEHLTRRAYHVGSLNPGLVHGCGY